LGIEVEHLIAPVGSQGTFCGLLLGRKIMSSQTRLIGIATSPADTCRRAGLPNITEMYQAAAAYIGLDASFSPGDFKVFYDYVGSGYGQISPEGLEAIKLLASKEGVLLDPIYSGKVMAGLIDLIRAGLFSKKDNVVFIHTGALGGLLSHALYIP
jgi:L-cysteate sulfo-lyase